MKEFIIILMISALGSAQQNELIYQRDTTQLNEVVLLGRRKLSNYNQVKILSSLDEFLDKSNHVTMIRRGNYAWEPTLHSMISERLTLTIDGMQIFGACTDKMDPVTSYVDVSNLEKVQISSGQKGTENGHNIGGGIDLQLSESKYHQSGLKSNIDLGYETNGNYTATGLDLEYSGNRFYIAVDGIYRNSDNYKSGGNNDVLFSQFQKYNLSLHTGFKLSESKSIDLNIIYDNATDIGYPSLPMDVSSAQAFITSLTYKYLSDVDVLNSFESKVYFNTISHTMDDSQRPDVPIRMDMPGWSDTLGFFNKAIFNFGQHEILVNVNGFYNRSIAEMTMFPNDSNQLDMFMYTWPDIRTLYSGIYMSDDYEVDDNTRIAMSFRLGYHKNKIAENIGLESIQIFHPNIQNTQERLLKSVSANYTIKKQNFDVLFGLGYGERAPSVSEGYGFFIFNSFDNFDYIGNPTLKNEHSVELNFATNYKIKNMRFGISSAYFYITNFIIGEIDRSINPMTIGANGAKMYKSLSHASIFDILLNTSIKLSTSWNLQATFGFNYGEDSNDRNLPLIQPISISSKVNYKTKKFNASLQLESNGNQSNYSSYYGEDKTPAYTILNINFGHLVYLKNNKYVFKYGIENIFDINYSTYADWNNILRKGRNFYMNFSLVIQ